MLNRVIASTDLWVVLVVVIILFAISFEIGFRTGHRKHTEFNESGRSWIGTIEVAILSILGLLLAFTFVMVQTRFDVRQKLVIEEANAIGTTYLRAELLPNPQKTSIENLLLQYTDSRLDAVRGGREKLPIILAKSEQIHKQLWAQALSVDMKKIRPELFAVFVSSLNKLISLHTDRVAAFVNRVPGFVMLVLLFCATLAMGVTGYNSGLRKQRNFVPVAMLSILLLLIFLMIMDLDRPAQGFIRTNQHAMIELQKNLVTPPLVKPML